MLPLLVAVPSPDTMFQQRPAVAVLRTHLRAIPLTPAAPAFALWITTNLQIAPIWWPFGDY